MSEEKKKTILELEEELNTLKKKHAEEKLELEKKIKVLEVYNAQLTLNNKILEAQSLGIEVK